MRLEKCEADYISKEMKKWSYYLMKGRAGELDTTNYYTWQSLNGNIRYAKGVSILEHDVIYCSIESKKSIQKYVLNTFKA